MGIHEGEKDVKNVIHKVEKEVKNVKKKAQRIVQDLKTLDQDVHAIDKDWKNIITSCSYLIGAYPTIIEAIDSCKVVKSDCELLLSGNIVYGAFKLGVLTIK